MAIESRKRKLGKCSAGAGHRRPRPLPGRLIEDEASDEEVDADDDDDDEPQDAIRGHARDDSAPGSGPDKSEDEDEEEEDNEEDEDEDEEEDDEEEEEQPPSPSETLTFGQILKRQEKVKQTKSGSKAPAGGSPLSARKGKDEHGDKDKAATKKPRIPKHHRSSKHAPAELPARFAVKRGRDWTSGDAAIAGVPVRPAASRARDPRFFLASMREAPPSAAEEQRARRNYAFLEAYRDAELQQLREGLAAAERARKTAQRKGKTAVAAEAEAEVAELRKQIGAMEARKRAQAERDRAQAVLEAHKQRERELVRQGKTPYYLKRSEQKKRLLVDQFAGMSEQQVEKALERRRKKAAVRERKAMPERRTV